MNDRLHWAVRARRVKEVRQAAVLLARLGKYPKGAEYVTARLEYLPAQARVRDPMNLTPTSKAVIDGLVEYGLVPDDNPQWLREDTPVILEPVPVKGRPTSRLTMVLNVLLSG